MMRGAGCTPIKQIKPTKSDKFYWRNRKSVESFSNIAKIQIFSQYFEVVVAHQIFD
jgi:hypothetical protein